MSAWVAVCVCACLCALCLCVHTRFMSCPIYQTSGNGLKRRCHELNTANFVSTELRTCFWWNNSRTTTRLERPSRCCNSTRKNTLAPVFFPDVLSRLLRMLGGCVLLRNIVDTATTCPVMSMWGRTRAAEGTDSTCRSIWYNRETEWAGMEVRAQVVAREWEVLAVGVADSEVRSIGVCMLPNISRDGEETAVCTGCRASKTW